MHCNVTIKNFQQSYSAKASIHITVCLSSHHLSHETRQCAFEVNLPLGSGLRAHSVLALQPEHGNSMGRIPHWIRLPVSI